MLLKSKIGEGLNCRFEARKTTMGEVLRGLPSDWPLSASLVSGHVI